MYVSDKDQFKTMLSIFSNVLNYFGQFDSSRFNRVKIVRTKFHFDSLELNQKKEQTKFQ
jgi:hypothetical protein